MAAYQRGQCLLHLIVILWCTHVLTITADYTSYGSPQSTYHVPWFTHSKHVYPTHAPYPEKSQWYPVAGPYTYGHGLQNHYATPFPHHHYSDYPSGVSQQQIVHIHDVGPPEIPNGDNYQEGDDYKIHNLISHVDTLHQDLTGEASSKVETRKQKPSTITTTNQHSNFNKRRVQNKPRRKQNDNKRRPSQASSLRHPAGGQSRSGAKNSFRKSSRLRQPIQRQQQQFRRKGSSRRKTRPTRRTHSRRPYYDEDYENYGRRRGSGGSYRRNDYRNSNQDFVRQGDDYDDYYDDYYYYYYDYDNYDETTSVEPTSTEESTTATTVSTTTTTSTTGTPETISTLSATEGSTTIGTNTSHGFHEYGPSNGNENISITYAPIVHDAPFTNLWYSQQGVPDIFQYKNYFSSRDFLN